jgi:hypothetical protein
MDLNLLSPHMAPTGPIGDHDLINLRIAELLALDALASWSATSLDVAQLEVSRRVSRELMIEGIGDDAELLGQAGAVLKACNAMQSGSIGVDADGLAVLRSLICFIDEQRAAAGARRHALAAVRVARRMK